MMLERADLKRLRIPLALALLLAGAGAAALVFSEARLAEAYQLKKDGHARIEAARIRLAKVSEEELDIRNNLAELRKFEERRMTGPEKRLEWIEAIAAIREKRRLFQVQYNLDPRRGVDYPGLAQEQSGARAVFMASRLKLELALLHEEDLLNFFSDLRTAGESFASLRSCSISRTETVFSGGGPMRPRLRASCVVDMITLNQEGKP